jgi:hypothetical protein
MARNIEFDEAIAIQKAMAVFWKKGFGGTTIRDLTEAIVSGDAEVQALIKESSGFIHQMLLKLIIRAQELTEISADIEAETTTNLLSVRLPDGEIRRECLIRSKLKVSDQTVFQQECLIGK